LDFPPMALSQTAWVAKAPSVPCFYEKIKKNANY